LTRSGSEVEVEVRARLPGRAAVSLEGRTGEVLIPEATGRVRLPRRGASHVLVSWTDARGVAGARARVPIDPVDAPSPTWTALERPLGGLTEAIPISLEGVP
jgi:hypothetical protein